MKIVPRNNIVLKAHCYNLCGPEPILWKWSIASRSHNLTEGTDFVVIDTVTTILHGVTKGGHTYTAKAVIIGTLQSPKYSKCLRTFFLGQEGAAIKTLEIPVDPYVGDCYSKPRVGNPLETEFQFYCVSYPMNIEHVKLILKFPNGKGNN